MNNIGAQLLYILVILITTSCKNQENRYASFSFDGVINSPDTIFIKEFDELDFSPSEVSRIILDSTSQNSLKIPIDNPLFVSIEYNNKRTPLLIYPGAELKVSLGDNIVVKNDYNEYLAEFYGIVNDYYIIEGKPFFKIDSNDFNNLIADLSTRRDSLNKVYFHEKLKEKNLIGLLENTTDAYIGSLILNYELSNQNSPKVDVIERLIFDADLLDAKLTIYVGMLIMNLDYQFIFPLWKEFEHDPELRENYFPMIIYDSIYKVNYSTEIKEWMLAKHIFNYYSSGGISVYLDSTYTRFVTEYNNSKYRSKLESLFSESRQIQENKSAPEIVGFSYNGKKVSTKDLIGKVVVIDFWASWCGNCIIQIPFLEKVEEEFSNENVEFLYISLDKDSLKWSDYIQKNQIYKDNFIRARDIEKVEKEYLIGGIPRYVIIDKKGIISNIHGPKPSSGEYSSAIQELLN